MRYDLFFHLRDKREKYGAFLTQAFDEASLVGVRERGLVYPTDRGLVVRLFETNDCSRWVEHQSILTRFYV